jgi:Secretion system C-terminal sorting domain
VLLQKNINPANATGNVILDISKLAAGNYFVKISTEAKTVVKKVIKW